MKKTIRIVSKPIEIEITEPTDTRRWWIKSIEFGIYVFGDTETDALRVFCEQLFIYHHHYKILQEHRAISTAKKLKKLNENLFTVKEID